MCIPITVFQGLQLCNSIISETKFKKEVTKFKINNCRGYWKGFLKRKKHLISSRKAVKFAAKHSEWCTYQNMKEMYKEVYVALEASDLAVKRDTSYWRNAEGETVELEQDALGCQSKYKLIHPNWLIFVDKAGSNTSQTKDGKVGGNCI